MGLAENALVMAAKASLDTLNKIHAEQRKTNALLEQLLEVNRARTTP